MKTKKLTTSEILKKQLTLVQKKKPNYSIRALARDIGLSASFVCDVLNGKKNIPQDRIADFVFTLQMDEVSENLLRVSLINMSTSNSKAGESQESIVPTKSTLDRYEEATSKSFVLLQRWYSVAILDLVDCDDFNPEEIHLRLEISKTEASHTWYFLKSENWVEFKSGRWQKNSSHIRFPTIESKDVIRNFHGQMIQQSLHQLRSKVTQDDFDKRLITGVTFSADPSKLKLARAKLTDAIYEIAEILNSGEKKEVYQLNCQLFPLTHLKSNTEKNDDRQIKSSRKNK